MANKQMLIMVAGHNYNNHCERKQKRGGKLSGTTRYEDLCQRRLESLLRYPKELGYPNLKKGSTVTAILLRFTGIDSKKEAAGRQIVTQEFKVGATAKVPSVNDKSWLPYPEADKLTGMQEDDYYWDKKSSTSGCFERSVAESDKMDASRISVMHLYWIIQQQRVDWVAAKATKAEIVEISIFSHSYNQGPVLTNTSRRSKYSNDGVRDPNDRDARADADMVSLARQGNVFSELVLERFFFKSVLFNGISKFDSVEPVFFGTKKSKEVRTIESEPSLINSSDIQPFASDATFRIWGCNVVKANLIAINAWVRAEHKPEYLYDRFRVREGRNSATAESRQYRKLSLKIDRLWKRLDFEAEMDRIIKAFPTKPEAGSKKVTVEQYEKWGSDSRDDMGGGLRAILIRGIVAGIRLKLYKTKKQADWKSYRDVPIELTAPQAVKVFKKCVTPKDPSKRVPGKLDALVSAYAIREMVFDSGEYGLCAAIALGINVHVAPPGGEGLYQEQRTYPALTGIRKKYPVHEVPMGVKRGKRYRDYKYKFFNPKEKKKATYSAEYGRLHEFYSGFLGLDYDDDGYVILTPAKAKYFYLSFD